MTGILLRIPNRVQNNKERELRLYHQFAVLSMCAAQTMKNKPLLVFNPICKTGFGTNDNGKLQPIDNNSVQVQNCKTAKPKHGVGDAQSTSLVNGGRRHQHRQTNVSHGDVARSNGNRDDHPKRPLHRSKITVVGDSMLKCLNPTKLRQNLRKRVLAFPERKLQV